MHIICLLIAVSSTLFANTHQDFASLQRFLLTLPESVHPPGNWENPDYTKFFLNAQPSLKDTALKKLRLQKDSPWHIRHVQEMLKDMVENRKQFIERGDYAAHVTTKVDTKIIVWGDLFGAIHSLYRDLAYFRRIGVLDNELKIVNPNYYFVFLGNVIDRSPYSLETLNVLLTLMERNPNRVFYLKGKHEANNYWLNFSLHSQITTYINKKVINTIDWPAYKELVNSFFATLPGALYINQKDGTHNVICISNDPQKNQISSNYTARFFAQDIDSVEYISTTQKQPIKKYDLIARIQSNQGIVTPIGTQGLAMAEPLEGATVWYVFSSPNEVYQKYFNIFYDAFAEISIGRALKQATIQLYFQDTRTKQGFTKGDPRNIATGETTLLSAPKATYFVGSSLPLTAGLLYQGQDTKASLFNLINECNKKNLLHNKYIQCTILEDEYIPNRALQNIKTLTTRYNTKTILVPIGSATLEAYFNSMVTTGDVTVLFPITGDPAFRKAAVKNIVHWRASYADEARALVDYMLTENGVKKFAFFYQNDSYGTGPLHAAHALLKERGITDWIDIPYNKTGVNYEEVIAVIQKNQPDAIGFFSISNITKELIRRIGIEKIYNKKLFGISLLADNAFIKTINALGIDVLFSQVVPNPRTSNLEIVKEFRDFMNKLNRPYNTYALESYICTSLYIEALKTFKGIATREQIINFFESFKNFEYKGLTMTFNPVTRDLGQNVWLQFDEDNWKEYTVKPQTQKSDDALITPASTKPE